MADSHDPDDGARWRVFVSHTTELREFPKGSSYVAAVERAISACGHVIVDMADFPAADQPAAEMCRERVRGCDVYVGVLGIRYGSPVRDKPEVSYSELEFDAATEAPLDRLMFLLDADAVGVAIPLSKLVDHEFGARQEAFRRRIRDSGLVTQTFTDPATLGQLVERSLRELAERRRNYRRGQAKAVITGEIPQEPLGFQPRADLLAALEAPIRGVPMIRALTGMRGVGKTHLAAAYARAKLVEGWRLVAWVNADNLTAILDGLAKAAIALGIPQGDSQDSAARALRHFLEADGERCLIVFDNASTPDDIRPYLPAVGHLHVIITSVHYAMIGLGAGIPVYVFSETEAVAYLTERTGTNDEINAKALAAELGYLPLALAHAAAAIVTQRIGYPTYLGRLRPFPLEQYLTRPVEDPYPLRVATAIFLSLESAKSSDPTGLAIPLMNLIALLSPVGVSRDLLYAAAATRAVSSTSETSQLDDSAAVDAALGHLAEASLVTYSLDNSTISSHRLVARVIRENAMHESTFQANSIVAINFIRQMTHEVDPVWQHASAARDLTRHISALHIHLGPALDNSSSEIAEALLRLRGWTIGCLNQVGHNPVHTIVSAQETAADYERFFGSEHPDTLLVLHNLAAAYRLAGKLKESLNLYERTFADRRRVLGPEHPDTLATQARLALGYRETGRLTEAINLYERTVTSLERTFGSDHLDTLTTLANLATAYLDAGRPEALELFERTLAKFEHILGPEHPRTLTSRNNLAGAYQIAGRVDEAIPLYENALLVREQILGQGHPDTLISRLNLAGAYRAVGRINEAMPQCERTLSDCERDLGRDHPYTLATRDTLADIYEDAEILDKAIPLREQTLADCERILGEDHPNTLLSRNSLAHVYEKTGRISEAIHLYERTLADRIRILGAGHPDTLFSRNKLAAAYQNSRDLDETSNPGSKNSQ